MARKRRIRKDIGPVRSGTRQTVGERIRWLRAKQKPFMTQQQLADRARVKLATMVAIERTAPSQLNIRLSTLKKIAHALDCQLFINIKSKPCRVGEECLPLDHDLPPLPKRKGRTSVQGRVLAAKYGNWPWKNYRRGKRPVRHKETSYNAGFDGPELGAKPDEQAE